MSKILEFSYTDDNVSKYALHIDDLTEKGVKELKNEILQSLFLRKLIEKRIKEIEDSIFVGYTRESFQREKRFRPVLDELKALLKEAKT